MAGNRRTEYEIAVQVGGKVASYFNHSISTVDSGFESMVNMAKSAAKMIAGAFAAVKVGQLISDSISTYAEFEQSMANTAATANATRQQYEMLEEAAREMGKATTKTAAEASDALGYMMLAGWDVEDAISGLEPVLRLSEATQMDLATCSDLVTDSMSALGLSVDGLSGYLDICTAANNNANTTAEALMEAFIGCGGVAKTVGADLGDMATALGVLANNGTKGAEAGTAMNSMLVRMTSKDTALNAMKKLGVAVFDEAGEFRGLQEVLVDLQGELSSLTTEEQAAYMASIAGTNYYTEMSYLLDAVATKADGTKTAWDELSESLEDSDGALMDMADTVTDTLQGAFSRLESAADDAKISLADSFSDDLKDTVNSLAEYIPTLTQEFIDFSEKAGPKISRAFATVREGAGEVWDVISGIGNGLIDNFDTVEKVIAGAGGAIITYKVASGLAGIAGKVHSLGVALKALKVSNPWILGITLGASAIAGIASAIKTAERQAAKSSLAEHFGSIALSMGDISDVAEYIVASDNLDSIRESMAAFGELDGIADSMQKSIDSVNKMNWKVSIGMELSADEQESYVSAIQGYVSQAQAYVEQEQYALNVNLAVFAEGDLERQNIVDQLNDFYSDKYSELQELGTQLNEAVTEAFKDGLLDPDEAEVISNLQSKMARIQEAIATSDFDAKLEVMGLQYSGADLDAESFRAVQEELAAQVESASAQYEESLQLRIANYQVMLDGGAIDQAQYDAAVNEFWEDYLESMAALETKSLKFQTDTIMQAYGDEVVAFYENMGDVFQANSLEDYASQWENVPDQMMNEIWMKLYDNDIDKSTKQAIGMLLESMQPSVEQVEGLKRRYEEMGKEIPQAIQEAMADVDTLSAMTAREKWIGTAGDTEAVWRVMESQIVNNPEYEALEGFLREKGYGLPEAMAEGIEAAGYEAVPAAIRGLYAQSQEAMGEIFSGASLAVSVGVAMKPGYRLPAGGLIAPENGLPAIQPMAGHAKGGIFDTPHMAWFAEDGPEAAIPLDGSRNAVSIWEKAGLLLGVLDGGMGHSRAEGLYGGMAAYQNTDNRTTDESEKSWQFVFSPQIVVEGNVGQEGISHILDDKMEEFREMFEQYIAEKERRSFR